MVEPSCAGLTISLSPELGDDAHPVGRASTTRHGGVGMPTADHTSLVRHLSIASADASDAAAGVRNAQRLQRALHRAVLAEAAVQRDEHALEAVALQVEELALGRIERDARRRPCCAARRPPRCPTAARSRARPTGRPAARRLCRNRSGRGSCRRLAGAAVSLSHDAHFGLELDAGAARQRRARTCAISVSMSRRAAAARRIDDEVRVLFRHARAADREALEAAASISRAA